MRLPRHLPDIITSLTEPAEIVSAPDVRLAPPARRRDWLLWACAAALALHVLALVLALYVREKPLPEDQAAQQSVSVTLDNNGAQQSTAPPAPVSGPPQPAQAPTAPPPPPPPAQQQPEVNLNLPEDLLATLPPPPPHPRPQARPQPHPAPPQHSVMMLNGMSYGRPSPQLPTPPAPPGMNMSLPQSDAQAVLGPEFTVKGDIGADWMSSLGKWVNAHAYYPQAAAEQNQQGNAEVEFDVDRQGHVSGLRLITSSGSTFLDQAWYGIFQGAQLPPFPAGTKSDHVTVDYTIHYILGP